LDATAPVATPRASRWIRWIMPDRLSRYVLFEVVPQFLLSLGVLSAVLVVSQLVRLADVLSNFGFSFENIFLPFLFIVLPFLSFTIPMAYMFGVLIGIGRLNADGEFTAMLTAGFSALRVSKPVLYVGFALYVIASACALYLEPWGRRELVQFYERKAQSELDNVVRTRLQSGVFIDNFLGFVLYAEKVSKDRTKLQNVMLTPGEKLDFMKGATILAPSATITGTAEKGNLKLGFDYGVMYVEGDKNNPSVMKFRRTEIDVIRIFQEQLIGNGEIDSDYRALPPPALWRYIDQMKDSDEAKEKPAKYWKPRYLLHQRAANSFGAVFFGLFAMYFSITDTRRGKGSAWIGAIVAVIAGYVLSMGFKWLAETGQMSAPIAAWLPNLILSALGGFMLYQKNRLPPSEQIFARENLPFLGKRVF
jgi:lipopolysaccharide export system permease protein